MMTNSKKRPESVLVIIYTSAQEVLLLRRRDSDAFWQSVTGSLNWDEISPLTAATRELREETGLTVADGQLRTCHYSQWFDIYPHWRDRYPIGITRNLEHVFCFEVVECVAITLSKEHTEYRWLPLAAAIEMASSQTNKQAIAQFVRK